MPVRKFRSIEEMPDTPPVPPLRVENPGAALNSVSCRGPHPWRLPLGVGKFRSVAEVRAWRNEWERDELAVPATAGSLNPNFSENHVVTRRSMHRPDEKFRSVIYGMAYPQAGAVDFFGPRYGLPKAISGHNTYWLWGPGENAASKDIVIVMSLSEEILSSLFDEVTQKKVFRHAYAMPWRNNLLIFLCRRPHRPLGDIWPEIKHFE